VSVATISIVWKSPRIIRAPPKEKKSIKAQAKASKKHELYEVLKKREDFFIKIEEPNILASVVYFTVVFAFSFKSLNLIDYKPS